MLLEGLKLSKLNLSYDNVIFKQNVFMKFK